MADDQNPDGAVDENVVAIPVDAIPEKFRDDPGKVFDSYANLERSFHESNQRAAATEKELAALREQFEASQQPQEPYDPNSLYEQWESDPVRTAAQIADQIVNQRLSQFNQTQQQQYAPLSQAQDKLVAGYVDQQLASKFQDWGDVKGTVAEYIQNDADLLPDSALSDPVRLQAALERTYKIVKAEQLTAEAERLGVTAADLARQQKLAAQTMTGAAGRPQAPPDDEVFKQSLLEAHQKGYSAFRDAN